MGVVTLPATVRLRPTGLIPTTNRPHWTDHPVTTETPIKAVHINELRQEIDRLRQRVGLSAPTWTDDPVIAGRTTIKAAHFLELRAALRDIWDQIGRGCLPLWMAGSPPSPGRLIFASDMNDLRQHATLDWPDTERPALQGGDSR